MFRFDEEECEPSRSGDKTCYIFAWIGQSFEFCDTCGRPYWDHLYDPAYGGTKGTFRIKAYVSYNDKWEWRRVNPIPSKDREQVKKKWSGYHEQAKKETFTHAW
jgi:hypothetical protein